MKELIFWKILKMKPGEDINCIKKTLIDLLNSEMQERALKGIKNAFLLRIHVYQKKKKKITIKIK